MITWIDLVWTAALGLTIIAFIYMGAKMADRIILAVAYILMFLYVFWKAGGF